MLDYDLFNMTREFIHALGGPKAIADWLESQGHVGSHGRPIGEDAVSAWGHEGRGIPFRWRPHVATMARERGITEVPAELDVFQPAEAAE